MISRIHLPTPKQIDEAIADHKPVIFTGMMGTKTDKWNLQYLIRRIGKERVRIVQQITPKLEWDPDKGLAIQALRFEQFAKALTQKGLYTYLQEDMVNIPWLWADYVPLPHGMREKPLQRHKLWISGKGLVTPLHYDPAETFHWVIKGSKEFLCFPPGLDNYYPYPFFSTAPSISRVDVTNVDLERFPRFPGTEQWRFTVEAGEVLYLPTFWWHEVTSGTDYNVSLNFVWFASLRRNLKHFGQFVRTLRHVWRQLRGAARKKA